MQFLLVGLEHVAIKSPIPESPYNVEGFAPNAVLILTISAIPLVNNAPLQLSPSFTVVANPEAIAMTFFKLPPSSTPMTSEFV